MVKTKGTHTLVRSPNDLCQEQFAELSNCSDYSLRVYRKFILKKTFAILGLIAGLVTAAAAHADIGMTGELGSTGIGAHATVPLKPNLNARFGANYLGFTHSGSTTDLDYDFKVKSNTYDALLDWYPIQNNAFRLTAGLSYNGNRIDVRSRSNLPGSYTSGGRTYTGTDAGKLEGSVDFRKISPYLGIGWGNAATKEKGWSFAVDAGVLFQGAPNTSLTNTGCTAPAAVCNQFSADVARERRALADEVSKYKTYPVLRVGINYRF
jgi:hypothetical protein